MSAFRRSEYDEWTGDLGATRLVGQRWVRAPKPLGWALALLLATLCGPGVFAAALVLTQVLSHLPSGAHP